MNRSLLLLLLAGCSTQSSRSVSGQLSSATLTRLDNPAIVVRTAEGERRVVHVARTGAFRLELPVGTSLHLGVATALPSGGLREDSTIVWPHRWTQLDLGAPIDVGVVRPRGGGSAVVTPERGVEGEDRCRAPGGKSDLPYDAKIPVGERFRLTDAFLEKGPRPAKILSVTMEGGGAWRLDALKSDATFTVTQADCTHAGNRDTGRDRVEVQWQNHDGSVESDHLDMRYCVGSQAPAANAIAVAPGATVPCDSVEVCEDDDGDESECDGPVHPGVFEGTPARGPGPCAAPPLTEVLTTPGSGGAGAPCLMNADCGAGLGCFQSSCIERLN